MIKSIVQTLILVVLGIVLLLSLLALTFGSYKEYQQGIDSYSCSTQGLDENCLKVEAIYRSIQ